jgi:CBS-domain-containing membrane protein
VMTTKAVCCFDDQDVWEAAQMMEERQVRRLAVLDREKRLVGVVSIGDLAVKGDDETVPGEVMRYVAARRYDDLIL